MNKILEQKNAVTIKAIASTLGFDACGIATARYLDKDARKLEQWLNKGHHGEMAYMEKNIDLRVDPTKLFPGARSVITLAYNYFPKVTQQTGQPKIAKYAYGKDYHQVIRNKLNEFLYRINETIGKLEGKGFVDSAPVLERAWARESGIGWMGKNGNLINKQRGSFFFLATLITDLGIEPDQPYAKDFCGSCTKCIDACPTEAILPHKELDATKCISYFTIELKSKDLPSALAAQSANWVFGCDICQDVCPWNRFSQTHNHSELEPLQEILSFSIKDWINMDKDHFNHIFKDSALKRTKWEGLQRNLKLFNPT